MRVYVIFRLSDYNHPVAITLDKNTAKTYVKQMQKEDKIGIYSIQSHLVTNAITEFECE